MNKLINHKTNIPYLGVLEAWCFFLFKNVSFQREILQPHTIASCPSVGSYNICMAPGTCIIFFLVEILQQSLQVSQDSARWWNPQSSTKIDPSMTQTLVKQSHNLRNNKHHQEDQWIVVRPETLSFRCQQRKLPYSKKTEIGSWLRPVRYELDGTNKNTETILYWTRVLHIQPK